MEARILLAKALVAFWVLKILVERKGNQADPSAFFARGKWTLEYAYQVVWELMGVIFVFRVLSPLWFPWNTQKVVYGVRCILLHPFTNGTQRKRQQMVRTQVDMPKHTFKITKSLMVFGVLVLAILLVCRASIGQAVPKDPELVRAAREGDLKEVIRLLGQGADVNAGGKRDRTALMAAARGGSLEIVKLLIKKGADVNTKDNTGMTALMYAAWGGYLDVVKFLIDKGLDVEAKDDCDTTVLMCASQGGNLDVVRLLIGNGADVNAKENSSGTPTLLMSLVRSFIDKKFSVVVEGKGRTALKIVQESGHREIVEYLKAHGAKE
jgi:ankyrin repeat protein